jgi:hypothetical protein
MHESNYMGRSGFYWFHGVVEDRQDPDKLGRVKIRILGSHTKDKSYIKTEDLQWAYIISPITSAAMNGIGETPLGILPGTWVFGFFRDGEYQQEPCILGTFGGIPQDAPDKTTGFNDPRDSSGTTETLATAPRHIKTRLYPFDGSGAHLTNDIQGPQYPQTDFLNESDTNRIARNEKINLTILQIVKDIIDTNVPIAFGGTWNEPKIWYNGIYPYIHVQESESGHVKVIDDTPNVEGQLDFDRTGTFTQVLTDGSKITKVVGDGYVIVMRGNNIHIMNDQNERCDHEYNLSVGGRWNVEVKGNINLYCHSNLNAQVDGNASLTVGGSAKVSASDLSISTSGRTDIKCGGNFSVDAPRIYLNSGVASPKVPDKPKQ